MSDRDAAPDPVDKAYAQSEALLGDDAARAARRARVLTAVAREPASPLTDAAPDSQRSPWRRGGWLAAACVAGFCLLLTTQVYEPVREQPPGAATTPTVPAPATRPVAAPPPNAWTAAAPEPAGRISRPARARSTPPPPDVHPAPPVARLARVEPSPEAFPAAAPSPPPAPLAVPSAAPAPPPLAAPPSPVINEVVVTGARIGRRDFAARSSPALAARLGYAPVVGSAPDPATRLRAAAADGQTTELETLLAQGVPVDAPDADGTTALMASIQADQLAAAALLRRHGASLDRKNRAGVSARDMATAKHDPELDQALRLDDGR